MLLSEGKGGGAYNDCSDTIRYNSFEPDEEKPGKEVVHDSCDGPTTAENATATVSTHVLRGECGAVISRKCVSLRG